MQALNGIEQVIIYLNGNLALWRKKNDQKLYKVETIATPAVKSPYKLLKSLSHLSVWVHLVLQSIIDNNEKSIAHDAELLNIKNLLNRLSGHVQNELPFSDKLLKIINKAQSDGSIGHIYCLQAQLFQDVKNSNANYSAQATELQLKGLHQIVSGWMSQEGILLENSRILLVTPHGPREELIEKQYFVDLFSKQGIVDAEQKSGHIICVEMLPEQIATVKQSSIINFLKKHQLNRQIGQNMLGDSNAMKKDILSQYAPPVLEQLCPLGRKTALMQNSMFNNVDLADKAKDENSEISQLKNV